MPFADKFNEAAQKAILRKIEADQWEQLPWLARLVQQQVTVAVKEWGVVEGGNPDIQSLIAELRDEPRDNSETIAEVKITDSDENHDPKMKSGDHSFVSDDFSHESGYDWRIIVADREKNHTNSWAEHFNYRPSQEEFEHQFRHFHARTHHVHVNQWVDGEWETITGDYVPHWNKEKPVETFTATDKWEDGKNWRIKFWDQRINQYNYAYFDHKPGGIQLNKYHNAKCFAVTEKRPEE
jgi:hypothetical protein